MRHHGEEEGEKLDGYDSCQGVVSHFSDYLDGSLDGRTMISVAKHLRFCTSCSVEFHAWRSVQSALGDLGSANPPFSLQAQLRDALAGERILGSYRSPVQRAVTVWQQQLAPACVRFSAGLAAALVLVGGLVCFLGGASAVQANDAHMTDLHPPRYLYSQLPPEPIQTNRTFAAVLVDAKVDAQGRVYDYDLVEGPRDPATRARIESNLLQSVFKPATVFGVPVPGHAMITYTTVSVKG